MLVNHDFAAQDEDRTYRAGLVLELATHAHSDLGALRAVSLGPLPQLADTFDETANLSVRTGTTCRFLLSVEGSRALRVSSREGMVFPPTRSPAPDRSGSPSPRCCGAQTEAAAAQPAAKPVS